jgi:hypothetical protein
MMIRYHLTGDESWFFSYYPRNSIWAHSRAEVPERLSQELAAKNAWFQFSGRSPASPALRTFPKTTIQHILQMNAKRTNDSVFSNHAVVIEY